MLPDQLRYIFSFPPIYGWIWHDPVIDTCHWHNLSSHLDG